MRSNYLSVLPFCLLTTMAQAHGATTKLWIFAEVKRNGDYGSHHVSVLTDHVQNLDQIEVVIEATDKPISPFISSELTLNVAGSTLAVLPISEKRTAKRVSFRFSVAPSAQSGSFFEISESAYTDGPDGAAFHAGIGTVDGKPVRQTMGGIRYHFDLRSFSSGGAPRPLPTSG